MMDHSSQEPFYIVPLGHPIIEQWRPTFEQFENAKGDMVFHAEPSDIQQANVINIQLMVMALQHYPHLIEKMVFGVRFDFNLVEGIEVSRSEDWKKDPAIRQWLFKMSEMPQIIFFVKDSTSRFFMIADDIMSSIKDQTFFDEKQQHTIVGRFFTSCLYFLIYCHNTGFQPDYYIDALIAEHDMPFTIGDVKTAYIEAIQNGFDWKNPYKNS